MSKKKRRNQMSNHLPPTQESAPPTPQAAAPAVAPPAAIEPSAPSPVSTPAEPAKQHDEQPTKAVAAPTTGSRRDSNSSGRRSEDRSTERIAAKPVTSDRHLP